MSKPNLSRRLVGAPLAVAQRIIGSSRGRIVKFALVGITGIGVNSALLALLVEVGHVPTTAAGAIATESAMLSNFALHDHWTFRDLAAKGGWLGRAARYNLAALGGLIVTVAMLGVLSGALHIYYLLANLLAVGCGVVLNYKLSRRFAWSDLTSTPYLDRTPSPRQS